MTASTLSRVTRKPTPPQGFAPWHPWDHNFMLACAAAVWLGVGIGFGTDIARHFAENKPPYPLIVHVHAVAFVGWVVLFTAQLLLIRTGRVGLHRRLGGGMVALGAAMMVLGPATALYVQNRQFGSPESDPAFLIQQLTDLGAFGGLAGAGVLLRANSAAHKRLMLLATIYISDAGFGRWLFPYIHPILGEGFFQFLAISFGATGALMAAIGAYDLATRRRLHPVYLRGMAWAALMMLLPAWLYYDPMWKQIAIRLIGH